MLVIQGLGKSIAIATVGIGGTENLFGWVYGIMDGAIGATLLGGMGTMSLAALVWFTAATKHFIIVEGFDEGDGKCLMS